MPVGHPSSLRLGGKEQADVQNVPSLHHRTSSPGGAATPCPASFSSANLSWFYKRLLPHESSPRPVVRLLRLGRLTPGRDRVCRLLQHAEGDALLAGRHHGSHDLGLAENQRDFSRLHRGSV